MKSELCLFYLDDGTLGGSNYDIAQDLEVVKNEGAVLGLSLNQTKSEVICKHNDTRDDVLPTPLGAKVVQPINATLLGCSIGSVPLISASLMKESKSWQ